MKENLGIIGIIVGVVAVFVLISLGTTNGSPSRACYEALEETTRLVDEYKESLSSANQTIDDLNSDISSAQSSVDGEYTEVNDALQELTEGDKTVEPLETPATCPDPETS